MTTDVHPRIAKSDFWRLVLHGLFLLVAVFAPSTGRADELPVRCASSDEFSEPVIDAIAKAFAAQTGRTGAVAVRPWDAVEAAERFGQNECDVLAVSMPSGASIPKPLVSAEQYRIGQARVVVIVHRDNPTVTLGMEQLREFLRDRANTWRKVTGGGLAGEAECVNAIGDQVPHGGLLRRCMTFAEKVPGGYRRGYYLFRDDIKKIRTAEEAVGQVSRNSRAIGLVPFTGTEDFRGVKVLAISEADGADALAPELRPIYQRGYVLSQDVVLFLNPKAPPLAKQFCEFAVGEHGASIAAQYGLLTICAERRSIGDQRLSDMKAGKGLRLQAVGMASGRLAFADIATDYVKAKAVVQLGYMPSDSDASSVGGFVMGGSVAPTPPATQPEFRGPQLLFLADKPSARAMEVHGEKWNELQPAEYMLAGRATAIIVNSTNKLNSLTLDQVRAIFSGELDDWATIGGTGLDKSATGPRRPGAVVTPINRFGLMPRDPAGCRATKSWPACGPSTPVAARRRWTTARSSGLPKVLRDMSLTR